MISRPRKPVRFRLGQFLPDADTARRGDGMGELWRGRVTVKRVLTVLAFVILAMLPDFLGMRTVPQRVGSLPQRPVYARHAFHWVTRQERERKETEVRARFARYYMETPRWVESVTARAEATIRTALADGRAATFPAAKRAEALADLQRIATEQRMTLTSAEAETLLDGLLAIRARAPATVEDILFLPTRTVLTNTIAAIGVMNEESFRGENGRAVRIVRAAGGTDLIPRVGDPGNVIPVGMAAPQLEQALAGVLKDLPVPFLHEWAGMLGHDLTPNLRIDTERNRTEMAETIARELEAVSEWKAGTVIAEAGRPVDAETFDRLLAEARVHAGTRGKGAAAFYLTGRGLLLVAAGIGFLLYGIRFERSGMQHRLRMLALAALAVALLTVLRLGIAWGMTVSLMPMGLLAGVAALMAGPRMGIASASLFSFCTFILAGADIGECVALLGSSWLFASLTPGVRFRLGLVRAGAAAGAAAFLFFACWDLSGAGDLQWSLLFRGGYNALWWLGGGVLLTVLLPLIEHGFGCATNVSLLELSDQNHPCLRRLILEAPGTYHHSIVVGNLAEAACEAIGANALLARVGSYYHDIGKILKPDYFTENDAGQSRHELLTPTMSTLVILAHVKDGLELGRFFNLPQNILDIISQHHGTSLVQYFYQRAKEQNPGTTVDEGAFRYDGPAPQNREIAIVCLADSVEAASRTLTEPAPAHIERLVHRIVMGKMTDHQLDESHLTFRDISQIEKSFCRTLNAMFHTRVRYPSDAAPTARSRP